ncbi:MULTISPECIES: phage minor head protein [Escherichia]|uniref:phage minor head protein n=1 Tax=Escherichia TaxID=561 RepID=UPI000CF78843|nr:MULTISPECIES: phage minor head protein [Escherichia]
MAGDIENRYFAIKNALKNQLDMLLQGHSAATNSQPWHFLCHDVDDSSMLYRVNASTYVCDMSGRQLAGLLQIVQMILDDYLLEGGSHNIWAMSYVVAEFKRGTHQAYNSLSQQSSVYASQTTFPQLLSMPAYQNQIAAAYVSTYSDWKGIADTARVDLASIIANGIGRGVNPRDLASTISKRLDVSKAKAKSIAQTEQVGALREALWNEADWASSRLGLNTGLLWLSTLKPTTRAWHAGRHGKGYTTKDVREFYAENGNRYNCYCSQIPVLLNDDGSIFNEGLTDKLTTERKQWKHDSN